MNNGEKYLISLLKKSWKGGCLRLGALMEAGSTFRGVGRVVMIMNNFQKKN